MFLDLELSEPFGCTILSLTYETSDPIVGSTVCKESAQCYEYIVDIKPPAQIHYKVLILRVLVVWVLATIQLQHNRNGFVQPFDKTHTLPPSLHIVTCDWAPTAISAVWPDRRLSLVRPGARIVKHVRLNYQMYIPVLQSPRPTLKGLDPLYLQVAG